MKNELRQDSVAIFYLFAESIVFFHPPKFALSFVPSSSLFSKSGPIAMDSLPCSFWTAKCMQDTTPSEAGLSGDPKQTAWGCRYNFKILSDGIGWDIL